MSVTCPHCGFAVAESPELSGETVACPRCGGQFQMPLVTMGKQSLMAPEPPPPPRIVIPAGAVQVPAYAPQPPQQPTIIFTAPPPQERLGAGGWFTRAFAATSGYMLASMLFTIGIPALGVVVLCGGCFVCSGMMASVGTTLPDIPDEPVATRPSVDEQIRSSSVDEPTEDIGAARVAFPPENTPVVPLEGNEIVADQPDQPVATDDPPTVPVVTEEEERQPRNADSKAQSEPIPPMSLSDVPDPFADAVARDWASANGKFSIVAKFRGIKNQVVSLEKVDGEVISVPLFQLSDKDRDWIADFVVSRKPRQ